VKAFYDGKNTVYSITSIPDGSFVVFYYDDGIDGIKEDDADQQRLPQQYQLNIKKLKGIDMSGLAKRTTFQNCLEEINVVESVLRQSFTQFSAYVGKSFYSSKAALRIDQGVELWHGFFFSVKPAEGSLLINFDVSARVFYQSGSLLDTVISVLGYKSPANLYLPMTESDRLKLGRYLRNLKVNVTHRGSFRKKFTVIQLTSEGSNNTRFKKNDNIEEEQTVAEYFLEKYNIKLKYPHLPCVVYQNAAGLAFLPLEVCKIVPGQRHIRKLNEAQVSVLK
jgi:eukaryotic translation initiation factor 2C